MGKTRDEQVEDNMKRVEANDAFSICMLADSYYHGLNSFQQDQTKGMVVVRRIITWLTFIREGILKKAKFHYEAAAMAGNEAARNSLGCIEFESGNIERAIKHWTIGASAGGYIAMHHLRICFEKGHVSRESMNSTLADYNASCAEMRSEARDAYIRNNQ
jgi:TPR repeat protein